jgi:hypothetical protein
VIGSLAQEQQQARLEEISRFKFGQRWPPRSAVVDA